MKRILSLAIAIMLFVGMLSFAFAEEDKVTLRFMWWGGDARHEATLKVIEMFEQLHPNVTIEPEYGSDDGYYQKLTTQLLAGTQPDIIQLVPEWYNALRGNGDVFYNLDLDGIIDTSGFDQDYLMANCTYDGHVQALPTGMAGQVLVINADFFERFDIPTDEDWTWNDLLEYGEMVHEQDPDCYLFGGFGGDDSTPVGVILKYYALQERCNGTWVNDDYTLGFDETTLKNAYDYFLELLDKGVMQPVEETISYQTPMENSKWVNGQIGIIHGMTSTLSTFETGNFELGVIAIPMLEEADDPCHGASPSQFLTVSAKCKNPEVAEEFLDYFYNDAEAIKTLGTVRGGQPTKGGTKILADAGLMDPLVAKAMEIVQSRGTKFFSMVSVREEFNVAYADVTNEVLFRQITSEEGGKLMVQEYEEAIEAILAAN